MDNASNNNTLMTSLESRCGQRGISFSAQDSRMRCMPHTIHLAAIKVFYVSRLLQFVSNFLFSFWKGLGHYQGPKARKLSREVGTIKTMSPGLSRVTTTTMQLRMLILM